MRSVILKVVVVAERVVVVVKAVAAVAVLAVAQDQGVVAADKTKASNCKLWMKSLSLVQKV